MKRPVEFTNNQTKEYQMIGLQESYARTAVERVLSVVPASSLPRMYQVWVGDEPVVLMVDRNVNKLLGVAANRWTAAVGAVIDRAQTGTEAADGQFRRCWWLERGFDVGFLYLSFEYAAALSSDARGMLEMKRRLAGMLRIEKRKLGNGETLKLEVGGAS